MILQLSHIRLTDAFTFIAHTPRAALSIPFTATD
jgi:hypothetical protein